MLGSTSHHRDGVLEGFQEPSPAGNTSRSQAAAGGGAVAKPIKRYELHNKWFSLHDLRKSTSSKCNHLTILWLDDTFILCPPLKQITVPITNRTQTSRR